VDFDRFAVGAEGFRRAELGVQVQHRLQLAQRRPRFAAQIEAGQFQPCLRVRWLLAHGFLVQTLADQWGYVRDQIGTTVWFWLARPQRLPGPA